MEKSPPTYILLALLPRTLKNNNTQHVAVAENGFLYGLDMLSLMEFNLRSSINYKIRRDKTSKFSRAADIY